MIHTEHSHLTEEELILKVENSPEATSLEMELADRLDVAMGYIDALEEVLEAHGIEIEILDEPEYLN